MDLVGGEKVRSEVERHPKPPTKVGFGCQGGYNGHAVLTTLLPILLSMSISTVTPQATLRVPRGVGWSGHVDHKYYHKVYTAMSKQVSSSILSLLSFFASTRRGS